MPAHSLTCLSTQSFQSATQTPPCLLDPAPQYPNIATRRRVWKLIGRSRSHLANGKPCSPKQTIFPVQSTVSGLDLSFIERCVLSGNIAPKMENRLNCFGVQVFQKKNGVVPLSQVHLFISNFEARREVVVRDTPPPARGCRGCAEEGG